MKEEGVPKFFEVQKETTESMTRHTNERPKFDCFV